MGSAAKQPPTRKRNTVGKSAKATSVKSTRKKGNARQTAAAAPSISPSVIRRLWRESRILFSAAFAVYLMMVLGSYSIYDPGFNSTSVGAPIVNKGGFAGAFVADFLLTMIGYLAYMVPASLLMQAAILMKSKPSSSWSGTLFAIRVSGGLLVLFSGSGLLALYIPSLTPLPASAGGLLGGWLGMFSQQVFGPFGTALIFVTCLLIGLTLTINISWTELSRFLVSKLFEGVQQGTKWSASASQKTMDETRKAIHDITVEQKSKSASKKKPATEIELTALPVVDDQAALDALPQVRPPKVLKPERAKKRKARPKIFGSGLPGMDLLDPPDKHNEGGYSDAVLQEMSVLLETKLADFNIEAKVEAVLPGPVVTRFEIQPAPGTKVSRITNLAKDLARSLAVVSVRVVEVIPGKTVVGIEIPNQHREVIRLSEVAGSDPYDNSSSPSTICLGKDIAGYPIVADLGKMPHLLVAGTTGSGKSVGLNAMLMSMLLKSSPQALRMIMIDPKMLELSVYDDIPHLLTPVVTDMKEAANSLRWCVAEMERRYRLMASMGVRNLGGFNRKISQAIEKGEPIPDPLWKPEAGFEIEEEPQQRPHLEPLPVIVVVIDEFADMMMIVGKKVEELIARIAQKARAAGIHLILATQRPSVDVITGLIKANVPARIAFQVSSKIDSRTILDQGGAEQLLGHGDMLYLPPGSGIPVRVHGAFVSDEEVHRVCDDWRARGEPAYLDEIIDGQVETPGIPGFEVANSGDNESDELYDEAVRFVTETRKASISSVQRKLKIGYNRAARMVDAMEAAGVVSEMQTNGSREVLAPPPVKS